MRSMIRPLAGMTFAALLAVSATTFAADKPAAGGGITTDKPAADKPATEKPGSGTDLKGVRLTKPFSELKDLSPDQVQKIKEIHKTYLAQIKALETKQMDEEMAVLNEAQKAEVKDLEAKGKTAAGAGKMPAKGGDAGKPGAGGDAPKTPADPK